MARVAVLSAIGLASAACSISLPMFSLVGKSEPESASLTTGSVSTAPGTPGAATAALAFAPSGAARGGKLQLSDHLGPEDIRRATGAMALALDPQGNGSPVSWDNAESRSSGRFTPVGGPFLRDDEVCRAFLSTIATQMDKHALQGTACRPSGGAWSIRELKPWKQPA
ncbi:MAG: RT0821/Lpp0805 family surface protein [Beijerinckiaceae bacterium]|jgi:surface antigen|nr:RT0821/Lpp0805 family surface protein [Beijerinckiaceae bacterium]